MWSISGRDCSLTFFGGGTEMLKRVMAVCLVLAACLTMVKVNVVRSEQFDPTQLNHTKFVGELVLRESENACNPIFYWTGYYITWDESAQGYWLEGFFEWFGIEIPLGVQFAPANGNAKHIDIYGNNNAQPQVIDWNVWGFDAVETLSAGHGTAIFKDGPAGLEYWETKSNQWMTCDGDDCAALAVYAHGEGFTFPCQSPPFTYKMRAVQ